MQGNMKLVPSKREDCVSGRGRELASSYKRQELASSYKLKGGLCGQHETGIISGKVAVGEERGWEDLILSPAVSLCEVV